MAGINVVVTPGRQIGSVAVKKTVSTTVSNPNFIPEVSVSTSTISDFETAGVENGYTFIYNSTTQKYQASPINLADANLERIQGGQF
jgi:hypothetical protein